MTVATPFRCSLDLSACTWQFGPVPAQPWRGASPAPIPFDLAAVQQWLPATVPGDVHSDLLANGRIPDPFIGDGLAACRWVEGVDWWYRTRLPLGLQPGQRALLEFDGIDYLSAVFVDGHELSRHEGMYSRQVVELPAGLASRAEVELAVRIWGSDALPRYAKTWQERLWAKVAGATQSAFRPFDDRLATLKTPMHFGWDFAPRLRAMGIWDAARLVMCGGVYIRDIHVQAAPLALPANPGPATVRLRLDVDSDTTRPATARIGVDPVSDPDGAGWQFEFPLRLPAGRSEHTLSLELPAARLWQPWERGDPCLYRLQVVVMHSAVGEPTPRGHGQETGPSKPAPETGPSRQTPTLLDVFTTRFGVRQVELQPTDQGHPWRVLVNGEPFFLRGVNWIPLDALAGRVRQDRYAALLGQARTAGVNFVRVWGGGGRERRAFYDLCDEVGLLVWQEFPIACIFLDRLPRSASFQDLLHQEAAGIVQALRNHPSLFLWCGGNEWSPSRNRQAVATLTAAVAQKMAAGVSSPPRPVRATRTTGWCGMAKRH
jgi:beta-mannosidase